MSDTTTTPLLEPVTKRVRQWLKTRAQRAELYAMPAHERAVIMREMGLGEHAIDRLVADHPGPDKLLPRHLKDVGLDADRITAASPTTMRELQRCCGTCGDWKACQSDLQKPDANARLAAYCPNTHTIELLLESVGARKDAAKS